MRKRYEHDSEPPSAGAKVVSALFLMPIVATWVGIECFLIKHAIQEYANHNWISWVPAISIGLVGLILGGRAWSRLNTPLEKDESWLDEDIL